MRLARYVLAELALVAGGLFGAGFASQRATSAVLTGWDARLERQRLEATALLPRDEISRPPDPAIVDEPVGTFLGMNDELLLARVRNERIVRVKLNRGGSSLSFRIEFADGSRAAFKPAQTNLQTIPRKEVAAYRLNRLLGLNAVPPAAPRNVTRDELFAHLHPDSVMALPRIQAETIFNPLGRTAGVVMYWVPEVRDSGLETPVGLQPMVQQWLTQGFAIPVDKRVVAAQLSNLMVFDFLTNNPDRYSGGNVKMTPDGSRIFFMDNTMAFFLGPVGMEKNRAGLLRTQRFSKRLMRALETVDLTTLRSAMTDDDSTLEILTSGEMRGVVARRDVVKNHVQTLIALHGEAKVLVFP